MFARAKLTSNAGAVMRAAAAAPVRMGKKGGSTSLNGDARNDLIKKVLFDAPPRPAVRLSEEDLARHETIERAWKLVRQQRRLAQEEALAKKFEKMRQACAELEKTSTYLFKHSQSKERNATFPRQLRTLTDTPPKQIWDYRGASPSGSVKP
ncbi:39S ribosomal protein L40, mitochondrial [Actinomortierella wolfii]|nr:39S ribosomal protein L40, mitochondrial [Actinomortierella wolfii]KAG0243504.1 39S ribosomal protein L40, mitochondrial [Actinomortierella wolfii]